MMRTSTCGWMLGVFCSGLIGVCAATPGDGDRPAVRTAAAVHALSPTEADRELPVIIEGVVTYHAREAGYGFFLQDESGAVFVLSHKVHPDLKVGDRIRVQGVSRSGDYAPLVKLSEWERLGTAPLPAPLPVTADELRTGRQDSKYVELQGLVRGVKIFEESRPPQVLLTMREGGQDVIARILYGPEDPTSMVESRITVKGVATGVFSRQRQMLGPMIMVSSPDSIRIDQPAPEWDSIPQYSAGRIFQFSLDRHPDGRVRVKGTVLGHRPGKWLAVQDGTGGLWVDYDGPQTLKAGDIVEFAGFPEPGPNSLRLAHAIGKVLESGPSPLPINVDVREALSQPCQLRRLEGRLTSPPVLGDKVWVLHLEQEGRLFEALIPTLASEPPDSWRPGAALSVVGVTEPQFPHSFGAPQHPTPQSLRIHSRSVGDVALLTPAPWYLSPDRVRGIAIGLVTSIVLAALFFLLSLALAGRNRSLAEARSQLSSARDELAQRYEKKTGQLRDHIRARDVAEADAALLSAERTRLARELHDGLEQGLTSVALMLDATREMLPHAPDKSMRLLETSAAHLRNCHQEVRRSVWGLRALALENADLPQALEELSESLDAHSGTAFQFHCEGAPQNLSPRAANGVFRIVQEAVANALKHAQATDIDIGLKYEAETVRVWVQDNGRGFVAAPGAELEEGHFGMRGLAERAINLGAQLNVDSTPGEGTLLQVVLSCPANGGASS